MPRKKEIEVEVTEEEISNLKKQKIAKQKFEKLQEFLKNENIEILSGVEPGKLPELIKIAIENPGSKFIKLNYGINILK